MTKEGNEETMAERSSRFTCPGKDHRLTGDCSEDASCDQWMVDVSYHVLFPEQQFYTEASMGINRWQHRRGVVSQTRVPVSMLGLYQKTCENGSAMTNARV